MFNCWSQETIKDSRLHAECYWRVVSEDTHDDMLRTWNNSPWLSRCQKPLFDKAALCLEKQWGSTLPSQSLLGLGTLTGRHTVWTFEVVTAWSWPDVTLTVSVALVTQYNKRPTKKVDPECQATLFFLKLYQCTENNPTATGFLKYRGNAQFRDEVRAQKTLLCFSGKAYMLPTCLILWCRPRGTLSLITVYMVDYYNGYRND